MKKLLLFFIILFTSFSFISCSEGTPNTEVNNYTLELNILYDTSYDLDTGYMGEEEGYNITSRETFYGNELTMNDVDYASYVLFWTSNNYYIGYYALVGSETDSEKYLDTIGTEIFTVPSGADKVAFMIEEGVTITNLIPDGDFLDPSLVVGGSIPYWNDVDNVTIKFDDIQYDDIGIMRLDALNNDDPLFFYEYATVPDFTMELYNWYYFRMDYSYFALNFGGDITIGLGTGTSEYNYEITQQIFYDTYGTSTTEPDYVINFLFYTTVSATKMIFIKNSYTTNNTPDDWIDEVGLYDFNAIYGSDTDNFPSNSEFETLITGGGSVGVALSDFEDLTVGGEQTTIINYGDFPDNFNSWLADNGIDSSGLILLILIILISLTVIFMAFKRVNVKIIIMFIIMEIVVGALIGWIELWLILLLSFILLALVLAKIFMKKGE